MPSDIGHRQPPLVTLSGALVAYIHTFFGFLAFGGALLVALSLHYHKVVKNGVAGWPQEYWPSVSATIGDWYPERNLFQVGIALMSGPRFMLVFLSSMLVSLSNPTSSHSTILLIVGSLRTLACGGWVYITSTDDHDAHDIFMGLYLILTPPWMYITSGSLAAQPNKESLIATSSKDLLANQARRMRRFAATAFFGMTPFMVLFFYRHKVLKIPGAYTHYAFFEWGLIIFDLLFDCASTYDLSRLEIHIVEAKTPSGSSGSSKDASRSTSLIGGAWIEGGTTAAVSKGAWSTPPITSTKEQQKLTRNGKVFLKGHEELKQVTFLRDLIAYTSECYIAFCFWTMLTALHPLIFFFSVYNMGVGGHEALLVVQVFALGITLIPFIRQILIPCAIVKVARKSTTTASFKSDARHIISYIILYTISLIGMNVWVKHDRLTRLLGVAASCAGFAILYAIEWGRAWETNSIDRKASTLVMGLLLSSAAKYANHSNNPAWPLLNDSNGGANYPALLLAVLSAIERLISQYQAGSARGPPSAYRTPLTTSKATTASASLGALLFAFHVLLSDSGSMIAWTWTGYPIKGPMAIQHGGIVLLASATSLFISLQYPLLCERYVFWIFGATSMLLLTFCENWMGFAGVLGLAAFLPQLARPLLKIAMQGDPLRMTLIAWLVADLLAFFQVLTVAYAFIPGGRVMRERTPLMMTVTTALLIAGLTQSRSSSLSSSLSSSRLKRLIIIPLMVIASIALLVPGIHHVSPKDIKPYQPEARVITAGIWTIHFSLDQDMWDSTRRMSNLIKDMQLDVIGLLETDLHRTVFGNRDLTQYLAESLGMYVDIGPGPDKHTWGAVLLSKFPIINSTHHLLPSPNGELAPAIHAVLDIYGIHTNVFVSHNGQEEDPFDRYLQTKKIAEIASSTYPNPFIFLGYVVTRPHAPRPNPYQILFEDGKLLDVDSSDNDRWCQYIGFRSLERIAYVRVSRFTVTDTEMQTVKFRIPKVGSPPVDPDRDVLPERGAAISENEGWAYPTKFIDPSAMVYSKHKYSPIYYPLYYGPSKEP